MSYNKTKHDRKDSVKIMVNFEDFIKSKVR